MNGTQMQASWIATFRVSSRISIYSKLLYITGRGTVKTENEGRAVKPDADALRWLLLARARKKGSSIVWAGEAVCLARVQYSK